MCLTTYNTIEDMI